MVAVGSIKTGMIYYIFGIGSESPRTTMFNMYYNGIKRMLRDGRAGIPNLSHIFVFDSIFFGSTHIKHESIWQQLF